MDTWIEPEEEANEPILKYRYTPEQAQAMADEANRLEILAIKDPHERIKAMRESGLFEDDEVRRAIGDLGYNETQLAILIENGDLYGKSFEAEEKKPLPNPEEIFGGPVTVSYQVDDGTTLVRPATAAEAIELKKQEILASKIPQAERVERLAAFFATVRGFQEAQVG